MHIDKLTISKKFKLTPARERILHLFSKASSPITYEDIKAELDMDKATFYRNIAKFEQEGILNGFESNNKKRYYELSKTLHAHFVCSKCHSIECLDEEYPFFLEGYTINNIIIHGVCGKCPQDVTTK